MKAVEIMIVVIAFLYGIVIGSFLNVCIYRIPAKESIVKVRSHCMDCGYQLRWYDMIPVFSWLCYRGRCRICRKKISWQYPIIEAMNGLLYVLIFLINGFNSADKLVVSVLYCLMASALLTMTVIDWRTYEIPFGINVFIFVLGVIRLIMNYKNWSLYVIGFFAVSLFLLIIFYVSKGVAIGGGDVKLMAAAGLLIGWQNIVLALALGCIIGSVIHVIRMKVTGVDHVLAMGPYLAVGILVSALWGESLIGWYISVL